MNDAPVLPFAKGVTGGNHFSLAFRELNKLLSWLPLRYLRVISLGTQGTQRRGKHKETQGESFEESGFM